MYSIKLNTFEDNLHKYNDIIMHHIQLSEMDCMTSNVRDRCVFVYCRNDGSLKQYQRDRLVSISVDDTYTLVKNPYPYLINNIRNPVGIEFLDKFNTKKVIRISFTDPITGHGLVEKTYLAENLSSVDMTWDISGNLLTTLIHKWEHSIINLKYVNSWIKNNIQELVDMRSNHKKLNHNSSDKGVLSYFVDIQAYIAGNIEDAGLTRLLNAADFKKLVADYLENIGDNNAYINTHFDTYEELEQYKANRLKGNK